MIPPGDPGRRHSRRRRVQSRRTFESSPRTRRPDMTRRSRSLPLLLPLVPVVLVAVAARSRAADAPASIPAPAPVEFTEETLDNGLRVIYAPLRQAPVVHVRVLYHVGSRDERPDRQGFAHL